MASLSRFRSPAEQAKTVAGLVDGSIDVVVGTHRLLSQDVRFKNLGLLVVDEEQRFGVAHKERMKQIRSQVDVLTLTATPIPRTLQMAMGGLREISIINTPPVDRLAIRTFVCHFDRELLRDGPSYTVDTLSALREEFPLHPLGLIIGMDAFLGLPKWYQWREILQLAHIVVAHRPGWRAPDMGPLGELLADSGTHRIADLHQAISGHIIIHDGPWRNRQAIVRSCVARHRATDFYRLLKVARRADAAAKGQSGEDVWQLATDIVLGLATGSAKAA